MTGRTMPFARPVAVPAPLLNSRLSHPYSLASSRFAARKDRPKVRLA